MSSLSPQWPLCPQGAHEGLCVEAQPLWVGVGTPKVIWSQRQGLSSFLGKLANLGSFPIRHFLGGLAWVGLSPGGGWDRVGDTLHYASARPGPGEETGAEGMWV